MISKSFWQGQVTVICKKVELVHIMFVWFDAMLNNNNWVSQMKSQGISLRS